MPRLTDENLLNLMGSVLADSTLHLNVRMVHINLAKQAQPKTTQVRQSQKSGRGMIFERLMTHESCIYYEILRDYTINDLYLNK